MWTATVEGRHLVSQWAFMFARQIQFTSNRSNNEMEKIAIA